VRMFHPTTIYSFEGRKTAFVINLGNITSHTDANETMRPRTRFGGTFHDCFLRPAEIDLSPTEYGIRQAPDCCRRSNFRRQWNVHGFPEDHVSRNKDLAAVDILRGLLRMRRHLPFLKLVEEIH